MAAVRKFSVRGWVRSAPSLLNTPLVRGSEGVGGTSGTGVVNSGSVRGTDVEGEAEYDDVEDEEVSWRLESF